MVSTRLLPDLGLTTTNARGIAVGPPDKVGLAHRFPA
jgi:hypothetical protein